MQMAWCLFRRWLAVPNIILCSNNYQVIHFISHMNKYKYIYIYIYIERGASPPMIYNLNLFQYFPVFRCCLVLYIDVAIWTPASGWGHVFISYMESICRDIKPTQWRRYIHIVLEWPSYKCSRCLVVSVSGWCKIWTRIDAGSMSHEIYIIDSSDKSSSKNCTP